MASRSAIGRSSAAFARASHSVSSSGVAHRKRKAPASSFSVRREATSSPRSLSISVGVARRCWTSSSRVSAAGAARRRSSRSSRAHMDGIDVLTKARRLGSSNVFESRSRVPSRGSKGANACRIGLWQPYEKINRKGAGTVFRHRAFSPFGGVLADVALLFRDAPDRILPQLETRSTARYVRMASGGE